MKKPIIGIPAHPTVIDHSQFFTHGIGDHYIASVTAAGGIPVIIPMSDNDDLLAEMTEVCTPHAKEVPVECVYVTDHLKENVIKESVALYDRELEL